MRKSIYISACCIAAFIGCSDMKSNKERHNQDHSSPKVNSIVNADSVSFFDKFKKLYPSFNLQIDTSFTYENIYDRKVSVDTNNCSSFRLNRIFIGKIENFLVEVKLADKKSNRYHLQSGNLKLWVCSLPIQVKANDKVLITGYVYDIMGFERVFGYPTIISKLKYR
jgi:hypothetical protein